MGRLRKAAAGAVATLAVIVSMLPGQVVAFSPDSLPFFGSEEAEDDLPPPPEGTIAYIVTFQGSLDDDLKERLEEVSSLIRLQDQKPFTIGGLDRRVTDDIAVLTTALEAEGYYDSAIESALKGENPVEVVLTVDPGERFRLTSFAVEFPADTAVKEVPQPSLEEIGIKLGEPAEAQVVLDAENKLIAHLHNNGFPLADVTRRRVAVEVDKATMSVTLSVAPGPEARFGKLTIEGLERTDLDYLERVVNWPEGEIFSQKKLRDVRSRVVNTNLFNQVEIARAGNPRPDGDQPVTLKVGERPPRTVGVGLGFSTDLGITDFGFQGEAFWEHRNLLGRAENLRFDLQLSPIEQSLSARLQKPNFKRRDQALNLGASLGNEVTDAFKEQSATASVGLERRLTRIDDRVLLSAGIQFDWLRSDDLSPGSEPEIFILGSLPMGAVYDSRDEILNATKGLFATVNLQPTITSVTRTQFFNRSYVGAAAYKQLFEEPNLVLANRGRLGTIVGAPTADIPAGQRLYAGGGGSVRGYRVDSLGPLDSTGSAEGGRSSVELSTELRWRFLEDFGIVTFVDAGNVYDSVLPDFSQGLQFAGGLGLRYYTPIGPIRFDAATPINKRQQDQLIQIYISIGQSF